MMTEYYTTQSLATASAAIEQGFEGIINLISNNIKLMLSSPFETFEISTRLTNVLKAAEINCIAEICDRSINSFKSLNNIGDKTIKELKDELRNHCLNFNTYLCHNNDKLSSNAEAWAFPKTPHNVALMEPVTGDIVKTQDPNDKHHYQLGYWERVSCYSLLSAPTIIHRNNKPFPVWDKEGV